LVAAVVAVATVEMVAVAVSFDTDLQQVHGYLQLEQNSHLRLAQEEQRAATHHQVRVVREFCLEFLGEEQRALLQIPELVVEDGHLP
jgi:hypothetical protein